MEDKYNFMIFIVTYYDTFHKIHFFSRSGVHLVKEVEISPQL